MIGQTLSRFKITAKLGEGGMGEVYRAEDTQLGREVAIKVLPEAFIADTERLARFEREARVLAALDHPNIAGIYEVGNHNGTHFLAMQLAEGEDLAERLARGAIGVDDALPMALQIAAALEAAHEKGIVHRDLKPANVRIAPDGQVKVLDFGLAKAWDAPGGQSSDLSHSPTLTAQMTEAGVILGTAAYMSPEQARGEETDQRADIWSFGVLLSEMLTGRRLFAMPTTTDTLAAVLRADLSLEELPRSTPPTVRRLLRRCLERDPRQRLHAIADARIELEDTDHPPPDADAGASRGLKIAVSILAVALVVCLAALLWTKGSPGGQRARPQDNPLAGARFSKITDFPGSEFEAAISPDGRFVAFVSDRDGPVDLFVGQIGAGEFRNLTRPLYGSGGADVRDGVRSVGFNGDGSEIWMGGGADGRLMSMPLLGGPARNFLNEEVVGAEWSPDGEQIVYHESIEGDPVYIAESSGTNSRKILDSSAGMHQHFATWSVDGEWLYLVRGRPATLEMDLWRARPDGSELEQLTTDQLDVRYPAPIDPRTVLYTARDADGAGPWLWVVDVETKISRRASVGLEQYSSVAASRGRRRLVATVQNPRAELWSVPILENLATEADAVLFPDTGGRHALAPRFGGDSVFFLSSRGSGDGLWRTRDGRATEIWRGSETALLEPAAVSPDGESVALFLRRDDGWHLHVLSADGAQLRLLSDAVDVRGAASWSPDGQWIVTGGSEADVPGLFKISVNSGTSERIVDGEAMNPVWSPDGSLIIYAGAQVQATTPLHAVRPDGQPVELPEIKVELSGERMRFLPDGSGLVYMEGLQPTHDFWLLDLTTGKSRQLTQLDSSATKRTFDITPDGRQIVFDRLREDSDIVLIELGGSASKQ